MSPTSTWYLIPVPVSKLELEQLPLSRKPAKKLVLIKIEKAGVCYLEFYTSTVFTVSALQHDKPTPRARLLMTDKKRFQRGVPDLREARSQPQPVRPDGRWARGVVRVFRAGWLGEAAIELRFSSSGSVSSFGINAAQGYVDISICINSSTVCVCFFNVLIFQGFDVSML